MTDARAVPSVATVCESGIMSAASQRRSRNPYREVLRTYCRWRFFWVAVLIVPQFGLSLTLHAHVLRIMDFVPAIFIAIPLSSVLASHLRELLGSPRARVTPGLCRAHFVVAGAWIALFAVFVPFVFSSLR